MNSDDFGNKTACVCRWGGSGSGPGMSAAYALSHERREDARSDAGRAAAAARAA